MFAQEQYVEEPPTVDARGYTVQHYLRMRGSARTEHYPAATQQQAPPLNPPHHTALPRASNVQQQPQQPSASR